MIATARPKEVSGVLRMHNELPVEYVSPKKRIGFESGNAVGKTSQVLLFMEALRRAGIKFEGIKGGGLHDAELIARQSNLHRKRDNLSGQLIQAAQEKFIAERVNADKNVLMSLVLNLYQAIANAELEQNHLLVMDRCTAISQALGIIERADFHTLMYLYQQLPQVFMGGLIILDVDEDIVAERMRSRGLGEEVDLNEISKQRQQYLEVANSLSGRSLIINGNGDIKTVHHNVVNAVNKKGWLKKKIKPVANPDKVLKRINK